MLEIGEFMRRRILVTLLCSFSLCACDSPDTPDAVVGAYRSIGTSTITVELRADGSVLEKIGGRELNGRWSLWNNQGRGCGMSRSRIEVTGLVLEAGEPQTNNRINAHVERWPRRLVLDLENAKKVELRREDKPQ